MKQVNFILVVLMTALMSVSFTSCMNSDDDGTSYGGIFAKYNYSYFTTSDGTRIVPTSGVSSLLTGEYYYLYCQYDLSQLTSGAESINVTLLTDPICIDAESSENPSPVSSVPEATNPLYILSSDLTSGMLFFDSSTLIMPLVFWYKAESDSDAYNEEIAKHAFYLTYDEDEISAGDTQLTLTINHVVTESTSTTRSNATSVYKAYSLSSALSAFTSIAGSLPSTIVLRALTNSNEDELGTTYSSVELTYPYAE